MQISRGHWYVARGVQLVKGLVTGRIAFGGVVIWSHSNQELFLRMQTSAMADLATVVFSVNSISLRNRYGIEATPTKKVSVQKTYFITNKGNSYMRVRPAISKNSSDVSYFCLG